MTEHDLPKAEADAKPTCFVICPIGKDGSATRKRSDKLLKYIIKAVLEPKGYLVDRADQLAEPGLITNQIVKRIVECDILIADLSESNPNVFYELAIRHGLKKPFIHMIDAAESIPFDNSQVRTISIDLTDLDSVERCKLELSSQVDSIISGKSIAESPISIAFDLENLKNSGNSDEALLAALFQEVSSVRSDLREFRRTNARQSPAHIPRNEEDLVKILVASGRDRLADIVREKVSIHTLEPYRLVASTTLSINADTEFEADIRDFLQAHTQRPWEIEILPF